ncbi:MAG TPA: hypothetical protein VJT84_08505 [Gaiellaceae bacterium]|nr:hypothetical protein [Gaiellaceae bacterium]
MLTIAVLVAGCGGGGERPTLETERVEGDGFSFAAPQGWTVKRGTRSVTVRPGTGPALASVTVLTLRKRYVPARFAQVAVELDRVTTTLASKLRGKVIARRTLLVAGARSRQYDLAYSSGGTGLIDRITFVLRNTTEYYVLCRWEAGDGEPAACSRLTATLRIR